MSVAYWNKIAGTKIRGIITLSDPSTRRLEAQIKDKSIVSLAVWETGPTFRWPKEGELWSIVRQGSNWVLGDFIDVANQDTLYVDDLNAGDMRLNADVVRTSDGNQVLAFSGIPAIGEAPVWDGDQWVPGTPAAGPSVPATTSTLGSVELTTAPANPAIPIVVSNTDPRNTNARTPTAHTHPQSDVTGLVTALSNKVDTTDARLSDNRIPTGTAGGDLSGTYPNPGVAKLGGVVAANYVQTSDSRLSDSRAPTGTAAGDLSGTYPNPTVAKLNGVVAANYVQTGDSRLSDARTPLDASVTDAKIATTLSPSKITGTAVVTADSRLSDTRTPTAGSVDATAVAASLKPSGSAVAGTEALRALGTSASTATAGNDSRLSDTRTPSAASITDAMIATTLSPSKITGTAVVTADSRLSDTRTPSAASITDAMIATTLSPSKITGTAVVTADSRLSDARTPTTHHTTHEPGGSDAMAVDAVAATGSLRTLGTGSQQATAGTDSRLSDARTPTTHASTHASGGSDPLGAASVADSQLATPVSGIYRLLWQSTGFYGSAATGTRFFSQGGNGQLPTSGTGTTSNPPLTFPFTHSRHDLASKTTKLLLEVQVLTNTIAPAITFTFGLATVTLGGASGQIIVTASAQIASTTVAITTPAASSVVTGSVDFDLSSVPDGVYIVTVVPSGTSATSSFTSVGARILVHNA